MADDAFSFRRSVSGRGIRTKRDQPLVVELSDEAVQTKVVREGLQVPSVDMDPAVVGSIIDNLRPETPKLAPRVVRQSVASGSRVPAGTVVDLVLASRTLIPVEVFPEVHVDLRGRTLEELSPVLENFRVRRAVLEKKRPEDLSEAERQEVVDALRSVVDEVEVDDTDPERNFDRAFKTVRNLAAFV